MKRAFVILLAAACMALSACSLLPAEDDIRVAPLIPEHEAVTYNLATVERTDLELTRQITCSYISLRSENLNFGTSGVVFDRYFVQLGDTVTAGQLLAQLDMTDLEEELADLKLDLSLLNLQSDALEEDRALALERRKLMMQGSTAAELEAALADVNDQYARRQQSISDEIYLVKLQIQECEAQIPLRQIYASIDGVITYLYDFAQDPDGSKLKGSAVRLADPAMAFFKASTDCWEEFEPGESYSISALAHTYDTVVVTEAALGLEASEKVSGQAADVYFQLQESAFELEINDSGKITIILDSRKGVLAVPSNAVSTVNDQTVVYYLTGDNLRAYKMVETGLVANGMTEIVSGLEEGETIIVG